MASSSLTVKCERGVIRTYGGNRRHIRQMYNFYSNLSLDEFLRVHPMLLQCDFYSLKLKKKFNKS